MKESELQNVQYLTWKQETPSPEVSLSSLYQFDQKNYIFTFFKIAIMIFSTLYWF